jgi:hypothetical protein
VPDETSIICATTASIWTRKSAVDLNDVPPLVRVAYYQPTSQQ